MPEMHEEGDEKEGAKEMSNFLIKCLLIEYIVIMAVCVYEKNWARVLYWIGACLLQIGILWGMK